MVCRGKYPYEEYLIYGPYLSKSEQRRIVALVSSEHRTTMSYARYLLSVKLGRKLGLKEQADHKDGNKLNDNPDNLQVLTQRENTSKSNEARRKEIQHGTLSAVRYCKPLCNLCREARNTYNREYMRQRRARN